METNNQINSDLNERANPRLSFKEAVGECISKYDTFSGRARRSEFWWFVLFVFVVSSALSYFGMMIPAVGYLSMAFSLAVLIPQLAVLCRRLHDINRGSWWVVLLALLWAGYYGSFATLIGSNFSNLENATNPEDVMGMAREMADSVQSSPGLATTMVLCSLCAIILIIILIIFAVKDSDWTENKYGPSPKYK